MRVVEETKDNERGGRKEEEEEEEGGRGEWRQKRRSWKSKRMK